MSMNAPVSELLRRFDYNPDTGEIRWRVNVGRRGRQGEIATRPESNGRHLCVKIDGRQYRAHRVAWAIATGEWPTSLVDHEDLDGCNNRLSNLRQATHSQNNANQRLRKDNSHGLKGITWNRSSRKWHAQIFVQGKRIYLGLFDDPQAGHEAYLAAAQTHFGEFARAK